MSELKYTVIKTKKQYKEYCDLLEKLIITENKSHSDEIDLLTLLITKWDSESNSFDDLDPVELIKTLMKQNSLKSRDLVDILGLSKGTVSKILNYKKGLSKDTIRSLSNYFKVSQAAFNRPYKLRSKMNKGIRDASLMNTEKVIEDSLTK